MWNGGARHRFTTSRPGRAPRARRPRLAVAVLLPLLLLFLVAPVAADEPGRDEVDAWIRQALHGTREERDRAVRLLAALGGDAIDRLFEAVRRQVATPPAPPSAPEAPPAPADGRRVVIYDLADLMASMSVPEVRALFRDGAYDVVQRGTSWEVRASDADHAALRIRLAEARTLRTPPPLAPGGSAEPAPPEAARVPARIEAAEVVFPTVPDEAVIGPSRDGVPQPRVLPADPERGWLARARAVPGARVSELPATATEPSGSTRIALQQSSSYRKDAVRGADGRWTVQQGTLSEGFELRVAVVAREGGLHVEYTMSRTVVARPMATRTVRPAPDADPIEVDVPQWTTSTVRGSMDLPVEGGAATFPLPGLAATREELPVLYLRVVPQR